MERIIENKSGIGHWQLNTCLKKHPIIDDKWETHHEANAFIYYYDDNEQKPITDPWQRIIPKWKRENDDNLIEWEQTLYVEHSFYRITTIKSKIVRLWLKHKHERPAK